MATLAENGLIGYGKVVVSIGPMSDAVVDATLNITVDVDLDILVRLSLKTDLGRMLMDSDGS